MGLFRFLSLMVCDGFWVLLFRFVVLFGLVVFLLCLVFAFGGFSLCWVWFNCLFELVDCLDLIVVASRQLGLCFGLIYY